MAVSVKRITLWRRDVANEPGALAATLEPLAASGADLQIVMGYAYPGDARRSAIEVYPVAGKKAAAAAERAGLRASDIPTLLVEGDNRAGLGHELARALGDAGININFLVTQVLARRYAAVIGFATDDDARRATAIIKKASRPARGRR